MENELQNQFLSPFKSLRAFSRERAIEIFRDVSKQALAKLKDQEIIDSVMSHDDVLIFFDNLVVDYARINYDINCEEFKASISKYDLLNDKELKDLLSEILDTVISISPNFNGADEQ